MKVGISVLLLLALLSSSPAAYADDVNTGKDIPLFDFDHPAVLLPVTVDGQPGWLYNSGGNIPSVVSPTGQVYHVAIGYGLTPGFHGTFYVPGNVVPVPAHYTPTGPNLWQSGNQAPAGNPGAGPSTQPEPPQRDPGYSGGDSPHSK